jgi:hypothetical protein
LGYPDDGGSKHQFNFLDVEIIPIYTKNHMKCNIKNAALLFVTRSRGSSGSIVSDYGLDDRGSIPDRAEDFSSSPCVQTGSGAHPAS